MFNIKVIIFLIIFFLFIIILFNQMSIPNNLLEYNVSGCIEKQEADFSKSRTINNIFLKVENNSIFVFQNLSYVCCAKINIHLESIEKYSDYKIIKIKEKNEGEMCRCICNYEINSKIGPLTNGRYLLQIYGIEFKNTSSELIFQKEIEIFSIINMSNPASLYCIEHNGTLKIERDETGEFGICIFSNNAKCEEWAFYYNNCSSEKPNFCYSDDDCECGTHIKTGECFYGSKEFVNVEEQCPDFCTGIAAHLKTKCINHQCKLISTLNI